MRMHARQWRGVAWLLVVVLMAGLATGCGGKPAAKETSITIGYSEEPDTLDPQKTGHAAANFILSFVGDPLLRRDPKTLDFVPGIAKSWEVQGDTVYTFHLRENVTFHDGTPCDAEAVKYTLDRARDPATKAAVAGSLANPIDKVEVVDPLTVRVTLKEPFAPFLQALSESWLMPISKKAVESLGDQFGRQPVGTGAWKVSQWNSGDSVVLVRNKDYAWGASYFSNQGPPKVDKLVIKFVPDPATQFAALKSGDIDCVGLSATYIADVTKDQNFYTLKKLRNGLGLFLIINMKNPVLQDVRIRQALNYAVDSDAIIKSVLQGYGIPAYGPLPPSIWGYDKDVEQYGYHHDLGKAKALLAEAGYADKNGDGIVEKGGKPLQLSLYTMPGGDWANAAQLVQSHLKAAGIDVKIEALEWGSLTQALTNGKHDLSLMGYTYNEPDVLHLFLHSSQAGKGINWTFHQDKHLDELIELGRKTTDQQQRAQVYKELQKYIVEQAIWVPLYVNEQYYAVNKRVQGVTVHPMGAGIGILVQDAEVR